MEDFGGEMLQKQGVIIAPDALSNQMFLNQDQRILNMIQETNKVDITDYNVSEWVKCRQNPLYFILNYVYFQEIGGKRKYNKDLLHDKFRRVVRAVFKYHMVLLLASRQLGKALSLDTPIPLFAGGYVPMREIKIGDLILDGNGNSTSVIAITDVMYGRTCYQLEFDNGDNIIADEDHFWKVSNFTYGFIDKIQTTKELFDIQATNCYVFKVERKNDKVLGKFRKLYLKKVSKVESVPVKCIQVANSDGMFLCGESMIPTHNSTIAAGILAWAAIFFPSNRIVIFNFRKDAAQENLRKIKYIIKNLPSWMLVPNLSRSDIKTYLELQNGSRVDTFYPSTTADPNTLARSLSVPVLYIDECAYIPHMQEIYGAAQPTLSTAREQAARNGYPYMILISSTPNGVEGDGKFFYEMHDRAIDSEDLFIKDSESILEDWVVNSDNIIKDPTKNSFIKVRYHWSENPVRTKEWYEQQKKELNFDQRKINQELDLLFVGGTNCIFDDDTLQKFVYVNRTSVIELNNQVKLDLFQTELDPKDYYLIGVDTASSIKGAFNAIEIFSYKEFIQIAEANVRLGSLTKYGETIDSLFQWLYKIVGQRIILCIENNSIGKSIIEHLLYHVKDFNYISYIYKDFKKSEIPGQAVNMLEHEYGINTNTRTKELMISLLYDALKDQPSRIKSQDLIGQMSSIQRSNRGTIKSSSFSDMFMAASFCAYTRKMTELQILPLLDYSNSQISQNFFQSIKSTAEMMNTKLIIKNDNNQSINEFIEAPKTNDEDKALTEYYESNIIQGEDWRIFMPIISPFENI